MGTAADVVVMLDLGGPCADHAERMLVPVGPWSRLEHVVRRLRVSGLPIVVILSDGGESDAVAREAARLGAGCERCDAPDALSRYVAVGRRLGAREIVHVDPRSVFIDTDAARRTLDFRRRVSADHVTECGLPEGTAVEAVSFEALERADILADDPYDRAHVTALIRRDHRFRALRAVAPGPVRRPGLRLTAETPEGLGLLREVYERVDRQCGVPDLASLIKTADALIVRSFKDERLKRGA